MPSRFGYMQATLPLAVLEVSGSRLTLGVRPRFLAKMAGIEDLITQPGPGVICIPVGSNSTWQGIEITGPERPSYYFWTNRRAEVMSYLLQAGFTISQEDGVSTFAVLRGGGHRSVNLNRSAFLRSGY